LKPQDFDASACVKERLESLDRERKAGTAAEKRNEVKRVLETSDRKEIKNLANHVPERSNSQEPGLPGPSDGRSQALAIPGGAKTGNAQESNADILADAREQIRRTVEASKGRSSSAPRNGNGDKTNASNGNRTKATPREPRQESRPRRRENRPNSVGSGSK